MLTATVNSNVDMIVTMVAQFQGDAVTMVIFLHNIYMLLCIASLIVNFPAKQIRTNVSGKY